MGARLGSSRRRTRVGALTGQKKDQYQGREDERGGDGTDQKEGAG